MLVNMKKITILLVLILAVATACQGATKAPPVPNRNAIAGDSVIWQGFMYGGELRNADVEGKVYPGTVAANSLPRVEQDVAGVTTSASTWVFAYGQNYAEPNTYGEAQKADLLRLIYAPHPNACVVVVLPDNTRNSTHVAQVRKDLQTIVATRPHTELADWSLVVAAHPEYLAGDHIHMNVPTWEPDVAPQEPAQAFMNMVWDAADRCN